MSQSNLPEFLTTKEVAELLRIKERRLYELLGDQAIPHFKATGKILFPKQELLAWIGRQHAESSGQPGALSTTANSLSDHLQTGSANADLPALIGGSHDPLLEWAISESACGLATLFQGSTQGLEQIANRHIQAAGIHLPDALGQEWNLHAMTDAWAQGEWVLVHWAKRNQGLVFDANHQGQILPPSLTDLTGQRLAIRQEGTGSRTLFDLLIKQAGLEPKDFAELIVCRSESESINALLEGRADVAFGLEYFAWQHRLGFNALCTESFDLLVHRRSWFQAPWQTLMRFVQSQTFQEKSQRMAGYECSQLGQVRWVA